MNNNGENAGNDAALEGSTGQRGPGTSRRRMLEIIATTAVALPVLGLSACGGDDSGSGSTADAQPMSAKSVEKEMESAAENATETMEEAADEMADMAEDTMDAAEDTMDEAKEEAGAAADKIASDSMAKLDESSPQAQGLGYKHDASTVTADRYAAGQQCSNCVLYQGGDSEWGGCPLFPAMQVKSTGWCSGYSAKS